MTALNIWLALLSRAPAFLVPDLPGRILKRREEEAVESVVVPIVQMVRAAWDADQDVPYIRMLKSGTRKVLITKVPGLEEEIDDYAARRRCFRNLAKDLL